MRIALSKCSPDFHDASRRNGMASSLPQFETDGRVRPPHRIPTSVFVQSWGEESVVAGSDPLSCQKAVDLSLCFL